MPAEQRREQLLGVAAQEFAKCGYRGTTALEIGRAAGVSEKLVLKHFGTKEALFRAAVVDPLLDLFRTANAEARAQLDAGASGDPAESFDRVRWFLETWATHIREHGPLVLAFLAELRDFPDVAAQVLQMMDVQVEQAVAILERAIAASDCRPFDARVAIRAALGAATVAAITPGDPGGFIDEYLNLTLLGILSDDARARLAAVPATRGAP
jgi:AcrR family transcriptional regulator